ncbi:MAG: hypothetical protein AAGA65_22780 [Actinomycetota bacterium]
MNAVEELDAVDRRDDLVDTAEVISGANQERSDGDGAQYGLP